MRASADGFLKSASRHVVVAAGFLALAATSLPLAAQQQPIVMRFGNQTQNDVQHEFMKVFKATVEKNSNGRIRVDLFPAAQLGPFPRMLEGVRLGNIQALIAPPEFFVGADQRFQVPAMAGLYKDNDHARRIWDQPSARQLMSQISESRGLVMNSMLVYDFQMFAFKAPATKLADFSGKRVRVLASEVEQTVVRSLGSASIPMPLPEVLPSLQQGTIDGVSTALGIFATLRYYDAAPHAVDTRLWALMSLTVLSKDWFDGLPADLKKVVQDAGQGHEAEMHEWQRKRILADTETWTKNNGKIVKLPADEQAEAVKRASAATQSVIAKNAAVKEFYDKFKAVSDATK